MNGLGPLLDQGLLASLQQLEAQVAQAGLPDHEHSVHFCLAMGFQAAHALQPGDIIFEWPVEGGRADLWLCPWDLAVEVKYNRPIPSGSNRPHPQHLGGLLRDFLKLKRMRVAARLAVLLVDPQHFGYLTRNAGRLIPFTVGEARRIAVGDIAGANKTIRAAAEKVSPWDDLQLRLQWSGALGEYRMLGWTIT